MSELDNSFSLKEAVSLTAILAKDQLDITTITRQIIHWTGSPGIGKTAVAEQMAADLGAGLLIKSFPSQSPESLMGMPVESEMVDPYGNTAASIVWSMPEIVKDIYEQYTKHSRKLVVLLDDCHFCPEELHPYLLALFDYNMKGFHIPHNVCFLVVTNNSAAAGAIQLPTPIISRMYHMEVNTNADDWLEVMTGKLHPVIAAFMAHEPHHQYLTMEESKTPFSTPRTLHRLSDLYISIGSDINNKTLTDLARISYGYTGQRAASAIAEFTILYCRYDFDMIFSRPPEIIGDSDSDQFAFMICAASYYICTEALMAQKRPFMYQLLKLAFDKRKVLCTTSMSAIKRLSNNSKSVEELMHMFNDEDVITLSDMCLFD